jgi:hypothetical protein
MFVAARRQDRGSVIAVAQEGPEAFTHSPGWALREAFLDANRHRHLIRYRQKQYFLQELYILTNTIPSESDGAHIASWILVLTLAGQYVFSRGESCRSCATVNGYFVGRV